MELVNRITMELRPSNAAERTTRLLERLARSCVGCTAAKIRCMQCVAGDAKALMYELKQGRLALGVVDCDTGKIECRDPSKSLRESKQREKLKKAKLATESERKP